jgi:hypothetical protein
MALWFSTELKGFNQLGDFLHLEFDSSKESTRIDCDEIRFVPLDDGSIVIGMLATAISNVSSKVDVKYPFVCAVTVHAVEYEIYSMDAKAKVKVQPSITEQLMLKQLATFDLEKVYKGFIEYKPVMAEIYELIEAGTLPVDKIILSNLLEIESAPTIGSLRLESSKNGSKAKGGYAAKAQTELERLNDRQAYLVNYLGIMVDDDVTATTVPIMLLGLPPEEIAKLTAIMALYR